MRIQAESPSVPVSGVLTNPQSSTAHDPKEASGTVAPAHEKGDIISFFLFPFISGFSLEIWEYLLACIMSCYPGLQSETSKPSV